MLWHLLIFSAALRASDACSIDSFMIDINSAAQTSECGPFRSLEEALTATELIPAAKLSIVSTEAVFSGQWTIENQVTILGLPSTLRMTGRMKILGKLELVQVTLREEGGTGALLSCIGGVLRTSDSEVRSTTSNFVEHFSGAVEVSNSNFQGLATTAFVLRSASCNLALVNSSFSEMADIVEVGWADGGGRIRLEDLEVDTAGRILFFAQVVQVTVLIDIRNSRIKFSNELISGSLGNLVVETFNLTVVDSRQIVQGSLVSSSFTFDHCSFLRIQGSPFDLSSLQGQLSISHSNISEISPGPVVLIPANLFPASDALVSISDCRISNVTNLSGVVGGSALGGVSVTFHMHDCEVWGVRVSEGGLFKLTAGVAEVSNVYYHDSYTVMYSLVEGTMAKVVISNVSMIRVGNDKVCFGICLFGGECHWNNVSIVDSVDPEIEFALAFNTLVAGFYSTSIMRDSYFNNPGSSQLCTGSIVGSRLEVYNSTFVGMSAITCVNVVDQSTAFVDTMTFVDSQFDRLFNSYASAGCLDLSTVRLRGDTSVSVLISMDNSCVILRHSAFDSFKDTVFQASNSDLTLQDVSLSHLSQFLCRNCLNSRFNFTSLTVKHSTTPNLFDFSYSSVTFTDLRVQNATCSHLIWLERCEVNITGSFFEDIAVDSFGGLITATFSSILIESTQMTKLFGTLSIHIGLIYMDSSPLRISGCAFSAFNSTLVYSMGAAVSIADSRFADGGLLGATPNKVVHSLGSVVWGVLIPSMTVANSIFENLSADEGGAVYLLGSGTETCEVSHTTANNNQAKRGGFLFSSKVFVKIANSEFKSNTAQQGGVLWVAGSNGELLAHFESSRFLNNSASLEGGVLYHLQSNYSASVCEWAFNTAQYGSTIASQISSFAVLNNKTFEAIENYTIDTVSGQFYEDPITIGCLDHIGQVMRTDNKSVVNLFTKEANSSITISSLLEAKQGTFTIQRMLVVGPPGSLISVYGSNTDDFTTFIFFVRLRECVPGEELRDMQCILCTHKTYSFSPAESCRLCPEHAECPSGDRLVLDSGYWRSSTTVADIYECLVPELCKGGYESECRDGHFGKMCIECAEGYFKVNQLQCVSCENKGVAAFKGIASLVVGVSSSLFALWRGDLLVHMVAFDYLHSVRIIANMNFYWPESLAYLYSIAGDVGSLGLTAFADPCLGSITNIEVVYSQQVVSVTYFVLLSALTLLVCLAVRIISAFNSFLIAKTTLYLAFLMFPMLVMRILAMFPCFKLGSQHFLIYNPSVECWSPEHMAYIFGLSLPVLLVAALVLLALLAVMVLKARVVGFPSGECFCFAIFLFRKYSLSCLLLFSDALQTISQVSLVILLNLMTEVLLFRANKCKRMFFFSLYEVSLTATTMLSFFCAFYSSSASSISDKEAVFILGNYVCLLLPPAYCGVYFYLNRKQMREAVYSSQEQERTIVPVQSGGRTSESGVREENASQIFLRAPNSSFLFSSNT